MYINQPHSASSRPGRCKLPMEPSVVEAFKRRLQRLVPWSTIFQDESAVPPPFPVHGHRRCSLPWLRVLRAKQLTELRRVANKLMCPKAPLRIFCTMRAFSWLRSSSCRPGCLCITRQNPLQSCAARSLRRELKCAMPILR